MQIKIIYILLHRIKITIMKLKGIYIIPLIGLGWFDETLNLANMKVKFRHIIIFFIKIELYKNLT